MINRISLLLLSLLLLSNYLSYLSSAPANLSNLTTTVTNSTSTVATTLAVTTEIPADTHKSSVPLNTDSDTNTTDSLHSLLLTTTTTTTTPSPLTTTTTTTTTENDLNNSNTSQTNKTGNHVQELPRNESSPSHIIKGRVVLATTREQGSSVWGLTADKAEEACNRFANNTDITRPISRLNATNNASTEGHPESTNIYQGHLLSVASSEEVVHLIGLMGKVPAVSFWTGGKLIRPNQGSNNTNLNVILTWSDGRTSPVSILGMHDGDESSLEEGMVYCLSLDVTRLTWQARDCQNRLPYACLITTKTNTVKEMPENSSAVITNSTEVNSVEKSSVQNHTVNSSDRKTKVEHSPVTESHLETENTSLPLTTTESTQSTSIAPLISAVASHSGTQTVENNNTTFTPPALPMTKTVTTTDSTKTQDNHTKNGIRSKEHDTSLGNDSSVPNSTHVSPENDENKTSAKNKESSLEKKPENITESILQKNQTENTIPIPQLPVAARYNYYHNGDSDRQNDYESDGYYHSHLKRDDLEMGDLEEELNKLGTSGIGLPNIFPAGPPTTTTTTTTTALPATTGTRISGGSVGSSSRQQTQTPSESSTPSGETQSPGTRPTQQSTVGTNEGSTTVSTGSTTGSPPRRSRRSSGEEGSSEERSSVQTPTTPAAEVTSPVTTSTQQPTLERTKESATSTEPVAPLTVGTGAKPEGEQAVK